MNMKLYEKTSAVKRVFVSVREQSSLYLPRKPLQPKPPTRPARFIRKRQDSSRCHTPDQGGGGMLNPPAIKMKPTFRRSLSPFFQPITKETVCTPYFKPKENESLISIPPIEKEDTLCMPYELIENDKTVRTRSVRTSIRNLGRNIDLKKGSFSKKQIITESNLNSKREKEKENPKYSVSSNFITCELSTAVASRTPSPMLPSRNNRCHALSKNFKINKQNLVNEFEKQHRSRSTEKENSEFEAPWQSILKDLENIMQIKDLSPHQPSNNIPRIPVKLTRV